MKMRLLSLLLFAVTGFSCISLSCKQEEFQSAGPKPSEKRVTSIREIAHPSQAELQARAAASIGSSGAALVKTGIRVWRVEYKTKMPDGSDVRASGLILVPDQGAINLTMLSYQHGTQFDRQSTISDYQQSNGESYLVGSLIASMAKGYYVVMPDYLGYGSSKDKMHPYVHRQSLASASLDMMRAAKETATDSSIGLNREVLLAGYSEGGYATMALHKMIAETAWSEFPVANSFPGAGPYDITATSKQVMGTNRNTDADFVLSYAWVTTTYDKQYSIGKALSSYFTTANVPAVQALMGGDLNTARTTISTNPTALFTADFRDEILNKDHTPMLQAMKDNDIWDWKPEGKVTLMHSVDDDWVPVLNAQHAYSAMQARGADVELVLLSGDHRGAGALMYFSGLFNRLQ